MPEGYIPKFLLIMKLTAVFIMATFLQASATGFAQKITYANKHASLEQIFKEIRKQTGYNILVSSNRIKDLPRQEVNFNHTTLQNVLDQALLGQPLTYEIQDKTILIKEKAVSVIDKIISLFTAIDVHGKVVDENGTPLAGVSITAKGAANSALTNNRGDFTLTGIDQNAELVISFVGYKTVTVKATKELGTIRLQVSVSALDQIQVIGYGTTSKRYNTGSVSTVTAADIQNEEVVSPLQAMEGMVPGLFIQQSNGNPGAISKVMLRGVNSITSGTTPLYIIDGVPFDGNPVDKGGGAYAANQPNGETDPLNAINPKDIESIDVLKDADATSIYGSRGANGVIIITTKRAKGGKTSVDAKVYSGFSRLTHLMPTLNTSQYLAIRRQAFAGDNLTPTTANAPDLTVWSQTANTDYEKFLIGNTAHTTDANLSLSGGDARNGFLLSGAYHNESTVFPTNFGYQRGSVHSRAYLTSPNNKLRVEFSTLYSSDKNKLPSSDITGTSVTFPDNYPLYNPDGSLYFNANFASNPLALLRQYYQTQTKHLTLDASINYSILPNLKLKLNAGDDNIEMTSFLEAPASASNPATLSTFSTLGEYSLNTETTYILEPQLDYTTRISKGKLAVTAGGTYEDRDYEQPYFILGVGYASDALIGNFGSAGLLLETQDYSYQYKYASLFGRVNYNWDGKYILSGTFRRDGSSRFGPGRQFGDFGSAGAAWLFTEESFMKHQKWLSFGKLRGSYGTVGNDQIKAYGYLDSYHSSGTKYGTNAGTYPYQIANPDYSWETTKKLEAALELGFFHDNLFVNIDRFRNRSGDLLANYPLSGQTGFTSYAANLNALVQNEGWEFEIKGTPVSAKTIKWNVGFNVSTAQNKLVSFPGLASTTYASTYQIGQPLNVMALYKFTGFTNGVAQVQDVNHDGRISAGLNGNGDYIAAGTTNPKFYGGFSNNLVYKNFELDVFFNFVKQMGYLPTTFPGLLSNQYSDVLNSPFKASTLSSSASYESYINYYINSTATKQDASYIRLRNITLSYNLPPQYLKAIKGTSCRLFITGQNLLTFTHYKGFDPETQVVGVIALTPTAPAPVAPPLKTITGGLQFSF